MQTFSTAEVITKIKAAVSRGGDAGQWLGLAYLSWYRGGDALRIDLQRFDSLDSEYRLLFAEMLTLRRREGWSDSSLYKLEQDVKELLASHYPSNH